MIFVHDEPIPKKKALSSPRLKKFRRGSGGRAVVIALDTPRTGTRASSDSPRCTVNRDATPPGGLSGAEWQVGGQTSELCAPVFVPTLEWEIVTRPFAGKGVPIGISESDNVGFRRFECLYYEGRVKLTEGTDYTYVVEGSDGPGTGCVVLTGMGDYRGTVEKTFKVKSNEVEPDPSEGKIDMSSAKFVGLAASYARMGQPVIPAANLVLGDTLLVLGVDGKGEMQPNREITREELAVVMMRYAKSCGIAGADAEPSEEGITDWADVSSFAMSSIRWALANGVISGVDNLDGTRSLCPHDSASRAQMAKIILNVEAMRG